MLITFEGIDGSGKSTQAKLLAARLQKEGFAAILVREPGGTELSERVRDLLLDPDLPTDPVAEILLFSAARAQLVAEVIRPALKQGTIVICDRFYDSTSAYQGAGRMLASSDWLMEFNSFVTSQLHPDRTYLIEIPSEVAARRRGAELDRMERSGNHFFERVSNGYRELAEREPQRILSIDGCQTVEEIQSIVWWDLQSRIKGPRN